MVIDEPKPDEEFVEISKFVEGLIVISALRLAPLTFINCEVETEFVDVAKPVKVEADKVIVGVVGV
jgi:hypothetical protein